MAKNPPAYAGDAGDAVSILGQKDSPGGGNGSLLQHSCLGNAMDRGAWRATVHRATQSPAQLSTPLNYDEIIEVSRVKL